jgi:hypothetical protein
MSKYVTFQIGSRGKEWDKTPISYFIDGEDLAPGGNDIHSIAMALSVTNNYVTVRTASLFEGEDPNNIQAVCRHSGGYFQARPLNLDPGVSRGNKADLIQAIEGFQDFANSLEEFKSNKANGDLVTKQIKYYNDVFTNLLK